MRLDVRVLCSLQVNHQQEAITLILSGWAFFFFLFLDFETNYNGEFLVLSTRKRIVTNVMIALCMNLLYAE
jgi:hypothetical protein